MVHYLVLECVVHDFDCVTTPINGMYCNMLGLAPLLFIPLLTVCFIVHNAGIALIRTRTGPTGPDQTGNQTEVNKNVNHLPCPSRSFGSGHYLE